MLSPWTPSVEFVLACTNFLNLKDLKLFMFEVPRGFFSSEETVFFFPRKVSVYPNEKKLSRKFIWSTGRGKKNHFLKCHSSEDYIVKHNVGT